MLELVRTTGFKKDYKKAKKQKDKNIKELEDVILLLMNEIPLDPKKHRPHKLVGNYSGKWECHIRFDWVLVYEVINNELVLYGTGSHVELFD